MEQDQQIATISSKIDQIINQVPDGFLPRVYYGLTRGNQTYRFIKDTVINIAPIVANIGDAIEFIDASETDDYIPAVGVLLENNQVKILIQGDYLSNVSTFLLTNMRTGQTSIQTFSAPISLQNASYLGDYVAQDNKNKQITVVKDIESNRNNIVFASVDFNSDDIYNWVDIGGYRNGINGTNIRIINDLNINSIDELMTNDSFIYTGIDTTYKSYLIQTYDLFEIDSQNPLTMNKRGNIKGIKGDKGDTGETGETGQDGKTPYIQDNRWYINGVDTGVIAIGQNGTDGENGQAFSIQSGLYSVPANYGQTNNEGPNGEVLQQLPTLPQTNISGKGYVVYDPLTTPLSPYYDLYYANNGDSTWTIIHPFSGLQGQNGADGATPYIQNGNWYINGNNTGVSATGPQGIQGPKGEKGINPMGTWVSNNEYFVDDVVTYQGSAYICIQDHTGISIPPNTDTTRWLLFVSKGDKGDIGETGQTGATPSIAVTATQLSEGSQPTATRSGTDANPIITFGIPKGDKGDTGAGVPSGGTTGQFLRKNSSTNYDTSFGSLTSGDVTGALGFTPANIDSSNLSSKNVTSWKTKLGISNLETAITVTKGLATLNSTYVSGGDIVYYVINKTLCIVTFNDVTFKNTNQPNDAVIASGLPVVKSDDSATIINLTCWGGTQQTARYIMDTGFAGKIRNWWSAFTPTTSQKWSGTAVYMCNKI